MEMWFSDEHTEDVKLSIRINEQLFSAQSEFQRIDVLDSREFGRILVADGDLMLTEKDEFIYHEMITHVPMAVHPHVEDVLVIGGGDGGVVRELIKYEDIRHIDVVEMDPLLVEVCRKYIPQIACSLNDERVEIFHEDGLRFIRSQTDKYDLIIIDSPNPFGPGRDCSQKSFTGTATMPSGRTASWSTRMRVLFTRRRLSSASGCTRGSWRPFPSAGCTRPTCPPTRRGTGSLALRQRSTTPWRI